MSEPSTCLHSTRPPRFLDDETPPIGALAVMSAASRSRLSYALVLRSPLSWRSPPQSAALIVPILVQPVLDNGVLSDDGYDGAYVWTVSRPRSLSSCSAAASRGP